MVNDARTEAEATTLYNALSAGGRGFTVASSPLRHTMVGRPFSPMVSTRSTSARPSVRRTRGARG